MKGPTIEEVRALQQETGEGMMACKKILEQRYAEEEKQKIIKDIQQISWSVNATYVINNIDDVKDILKDIVGVLEYLVKKA